MVVRLSPKCKGSQAPDPQLLVLRVLCARLVSHTLGIAEFLGKLQYDELIPLLPWTPIVIRRSDVRGVW